MTTRELTTMVEIVIVATGVLLTLLIAGAVLYWMVNEQRGSSARRAPPQDSRVDRQESGRAEQSQGDQS